MESYSVRPCGPAHIEQVPLSLAQQRLWVLSHVEGLLDGYTVKAGFVVRGVLDMTAFQRALDGLVARHEALRTTFPAKDGALVQYVSSAGQCGLELEEIDLRAQSDATGRDEIVARAMRTPFDLEHGPVVRALLIREPPDRCTFVFSTHHIISDGQSIDILLDELSALYAAYTHGEADPLPVAPQYRDYASWQAEHLSGPRLQQQADYWVRALSGAPEVLQLPWDRPRPARLDYRGALVPFALDSKVTNGLRALNRRRRTSMYMTLLAAWAAVLARWSGCPDVIVGGPVANRSRTEFERVIGFLVNTVAFRFDASPSLTIADWLAHVKTRVLAVHAHADMPFDKVVELTNPPRSADHNPIIQAMFVWNDRRGDRLSLPGAQVEPLPETAFPVIARFDLRLSLADRGDQIVGQLEYATALFERESITRYLGSLERLIEAMVADDGQLLHSVPLLPASEERTLLSDWNATTTAYETRGVAELFLAQAARTPDVAALVSGRDVVRYAALAADVRAVAAALAAHGVGPEVRVGVYTERDIGFVVAVLGVLAAGGAYVPLDPAAPPARIAAVLADSTPHVIVTAAARVAQVPVGPWRALALAPLMRGPQLAAARRVPGAALAYVLYTSGSTGTPKGVMVSQAALANYVQWAGATYYAAGTGGSPAMHAIGFDALVTTLFGPLVQGQAVTLPAAGEEVAAIVAAARGETPPYRLVKVTPSHLKLVQAALPATGAVAPTAQLMIGGEALVPADVAAWQARFPAVPVVNHFGPTEATVGCCAYALPGPVGDVASVPIGRPIANTRLYVLDRRGLPVPVGVTGELYVGGAAVARGYWQQPGVTATKFIADPFGPVAGARLYKTGDLARWRGEGVLEFLGRTDAQVKVRGYRVELGEIEARLAHHAGVQASVVVARPRADGESELVAYYLTAAADGPTPAQLRAHVAQALPGYMVPAAYVRLEQLPLTAHGKLDRPALPAPAAAAYATQPYEPPVGAIETAIAAVWAEVLPQARLGRHDDFFALGGHSLQIVQTLNLLQQRGIHVPAADLVTHTTVTALAAHVEAEGLFAPRDEAVLVRPGVADESPLFLVHASLGDLYIARLAPYVDEAIPIYALPAPSPDRPQPRTIEGMAARLVRLMRAIQPAGPYRLAGYSLGGVLAYEMVVQLLGVAERVAFLGLLDSVYDPGLADFQKERPLDDSDQNALPAHAGQDADVLRRLRAYAIARMHYAALPIDHPVHLFVARDRAQRDPFLGWDALVPTSAIAIVPVPGTHASIVREPQIDALGRAVSNALRGAAHGGQRAAASPARSVMRLRSGTPGGPVLFCVPGAGSSVSSFIELTNVVPSSWNVYGLQPRGFESDVVPHSTVAAAARACLRHLCDVHPAGPVHVLGHSFGGWIALELACVLVEQAHPIGSVTILDSEPPHHDPSELHEYDSTDVIMKWLESMELLLGKPAPFGRQDFDLLDEQAQRQRLHEFLVREGVLPARSRPTDLLGSLRTFASAVRATFVPSAVYHGRVRLITVDDPRVSIETNRQQQTALFEGWAAWAPNLTSCHCPGNHVTVLRPPHVTSLMQLLQHEITG